MTRKIEFNAVDFFRGVRDQQAALLKGKSNAEIIAFFRAFGKRKAGLARHSAARVKGSAHRAA